MMQQLALLSVYGVVGWSQSCSQWWR